MGLGRATGHGGERTERTSVRPVATLPCARTGVDRCCLLKPKGGQPHERRSGGT
jgi:hypothetical protein